MSITTQDLYEPLAPKPVKAPFRLTFGPVPALVVSGLLTAGLATWILSVDDPLGGEPRVVVALPVMPPPPTSASPSDAGAPNTAVPSTPAPDTNTISIITPGGPGQQMQVRTVEVPDARTGLSPAPDARLVDKTNHGMLPRIGPDGARPSRVYARPVEPTLTPGRNQPRIAILIGGMGLSPQATAEAISRLPADVTLAFAPYGNNLQRQVDRARADGHEVMLQVPMEPFDFPANDPGPRTLLSNLSPDQNLDRLHWSLGRFTGYTGITNFMGAKLTSTPAALRPMLTELRSRGLVFVDDGSSPRSQAPQLARDLGLGHARATVAIDADPTPNRIDAALAQLEEEAQRNGSALGVGAALPLTIERISRWARDLDRRGIVLVPVSAIITGDRSSPRS